MTVASKPGTGPTGPTEGQPVTVMLVLDSVVGGGAEQSTVSLLPHLIDRGIRPVMVTLHDRPGLQDDVLAAGVDLHHVAGGGGRTGWVARLAHTIDALDPDLVHTSLFEADVCGRTAARLRRVPVVTTLATERYGPTHLAQPELSRPKVRAAQALDAVTARLTRRLHAVSDHVADTMATHLRYPRHRIDVVHRGRPMQPAGAALRSVRATGQARRSLGLGPEPLLLAVARHQQPKGIDRMIEAMPAVLGRYPTATLLVAGRPGAQTPQLSAAVERLGLDRSIRFLGHRDDVDELLVAADLFVLPSRREGLPGSLLEAMAVGTPAVVSDIPQVTEVVRPDQAWIVDAASPAQLAAAAIEALASPKVADERAGRARRRFLEAFTIDRSADGMAAFYRRSLQGARAARR